jgi:ribosomal protein S3
VAPRGHPHQAGRQGVPHEREHRGVEVERAANKAKVIVFTARPGMVIGKGGKGIETLKTGNVGTAAKGETVFPGVQSFTDNEVFIDVQEIRKAETSPSSWPRTSRPSSSAASPSVAR